MKCRYSDCIYYYDSNADCNQTNPSDDCFKDAYGKWFQKDSEYFKVGNR